MSLDGPLGAFTDAFMSKMMEVELAEATYIQAIGGRYDRPIGAACGIHPELPHPAFNPALNLDAQGQDVTAFVHRIEETYAQVGAAPMFVCSPLSQPNDIALLIQVRGLVELQRRLWMELSNAPPSMPDDPRLRVDLCSDPRLWSETGALGFEAPMSRGLLERLAAYTLKARSHRLFIAHFAGEPAGVAEMSVDEGIAVIRRVAVLPKFRKRPVARALVHEACEAAYKFDAFRTLTRIIVGSAAQEVFESLGFAGSHLSTDLVREFPPFLMD